VDRTADPKKTALSGRGLRAATFHVRDKKSARQQARKTRLTKTSSQNRVHKKEAASKAASFQMV
jgi:hypothetical protein